MKVLVLTGKGTEDITKLEIKELIGKEVRLEDQGWVIFETDSEDDIFKLNYLGQSIERVVRLFNHFEYTNPSDVMQKLKQISDTVSFDEWIDETFVVKCLNENKDEFISQEVAGELGGHIIEKTQKKVDFKKYSVQFFVYITKTHCFFGIDFSGFELDKREYRMFIGSDTLKGTTAYSLLRIGGFKPEMDFMDPFCRSGTVAIEAALYSTRFSIHKFSKDKFAFVKLKPYKKYDWDEYFDKIDEKTDLKVKTNIIALDATFKDVVAAKKNAKIAGIIKNINFSKLNLEWLDTKMGKNSLDLVCTRPVQSGKRAGKDVIKKLYKEFFYQAEFIMRKGGKVVCLMQKQEDIPMLKQYAGEYKFKITHERIIMQGEEVWKAFVFER